MSLSLGPSSRVTAVVVKECPKEKSTLASKAVIHGSRRLATRLTARGLSVRGLNFLRKRCLKVAASQTEAFTDEDLGDCEVVMGKDVVIGTEEEEGDSGSAEKVIERKDVDIVKGDSGLVAHLVQPVKNYNGSGILLLTDVRGHEDKETRDFAYRLACFGYSVLIPDLFHGNPWDPAFATQDYEGWRATHTESRVAADVDAAAVYLRNLLNPPKSPGLGRIAVLGFCFGGGRVIEALARDGQRAKDHLFSAAVFFYGTRFDAALASSIRVPLLLVTGDADPLCPMEVVQNVARKAGKEGKRDVVTRVYAGRDHGFAHKPKSTEEDEDAEDAFQATKHWLLEHLLEGSPDWLNPIL